jgi:aminoglycoside 6'-N-acetyltransferase
MTCRCWSGKLLAQRLRADGAPVVAIDPDVENLRARHAYAKAGFRGEAVMESGAGPAVLMLFGEGRLAS